eukprot:COSAG01_NODE_3796_length_5688_cov_4.251208_3_plen_304_part_00
MPERGNVTGCSGGATIAPDAARTPTLVICGGTTATPSNRSDPLLRSWDEGTSATKFASVPGPAAYFPPQIPGRWDCSVTREPSGSYVTTFGSCIMAHGRVRPHQGTGYCDGAKQDGTPQVLSYVSSDLKTWRYLGEQFRHPAWTWPSPTADVSAAGQLVITKPRMQHVPRVECPYQHTDLLTNKTILKLSMAGTAKDYVLVGTLPGNGSSFVPDARSSPTGTLLDWGGLYASAFLADTQHARSIMYGWIFASYDLAEAVGGATFDCALSLPRVMGTRRLASGAVVPTWELAVRRPLRPFWRPF